MSIINKITYCAPCLFGLESVLAFEIKRIGGEGVETTDGRVLFQGGPELLARANLWLRTAERVGVVLGRFSAESFTELFDGVEALPWEDWIGRNDAFPVKGWSLKSTLHSIPSCQSIVKKAVAKRLGRVYGLEVLPETGAQMQIQFTIMKDQVTVMLDTSGEGLHKRGYRPEANLAPIKETLAAGMADLARIHGGVVVDPMCGSGTLLIETALRVFRIAPGLTRAFAGEEWGCIDRRVWQDERESALEQIEMDRELQLIGYDVDPQAVKITMQNAKRAGISRYLKVNCQDIGDLKLGGGETVLCNPPYGERMDATNRELDDLYRRMGKVLRGSAAAIITPHEEMEQLFGTKAKRKRKLYNGMIPCNLYLYEGRK